jgi:tetratricopeptide (TPR) repeat protein
MPVVTAFVLAQALAGPWSSGRPAECADETGRVANVWERAKSPELRRYCNLVAGGSSKLAGSTVAAAAALDAAREAEGVLPGRGASRALEGRALLALGKVDEALAALRDASARDGKVLGDPLVLVAWARVLARTNHRQEAADAYRALLPRASAFSKADRAAMTLEAGLVTMTRGAAGLDDAIAALRESLRESSEDGIRDIAALALALALDRGGQVDESHALLLERSHGDPRRVVALNASKDVLAVDPGETPALVALALEMNDAAGARDAWEAYLGGAASGPWSAHAHGHLAALTGKRAAPRVVR